MVLPIERMTELIAWLLDIPKARLHPYTHFKDDLLLDDFDLALLISTMERHLGIYLSEEDASRIETVQDLSRRMQPAGLC